MPLPDERLPTFETTDVGFVTGNVPVHALHLWAPEEGLAGRAEASRVRVSEDDSVVSSGTAQETIYAQVASTSGLIQRAPHFFARLGFGASLPTRARGAFIQDTWRVTYPSAESLVERAAAITDGPRYQAIENRPRAAEFAEMVAGGALAITSGYEGGALDILISAPAWALLDPDQRGAIGAKARQALHVGAQAPEGFRSSLGKAINSLTILGAIVLDSKESAGALGALLAPEGSGDSQTREIGMAAMSALKERLGALEQESQGS